MKRNISIVGLLFMSMSAIIGSGWLFATSYADTLAGPAALIAWVIGAALVVIIAFVFAEICTIVPVIGSSSRIPHFTHGTLTSYVFACITWLSYLMYAPTEAQATIQYLSVKFPSLTISSSGALSLHGYILIIIILFFFSVINFYSIKWLIKINNYSFICYYLYCRSNFNVNIKNKITKSKKTFQIKIRSFILTFSTIFLYFNAILVWVGNDI